MAYIVGFLMCDGYVHTNTNGREEVWLDIKSTDICVLEFIVSEVSPTIKIRSRSRFDKRTQNTYHISNIRLSSQTMTSDLRELGIVKRKTGKESVPNIPGEYIPDFLRGVIDGDGCINPKKVVIANKEYMGATIQITSMSQQFLIDIMKTCNNFGNIGIRGKNKDLYVWEMSRRNEVIQILNWIYNGGFCLQRKFEKFKLILEYNDLMLDNIISKNTIIGLENKRASL